MYSASWRRMSSWKLIVTQLIKKFHILKEPQVHHRVYWGLSLDPILIHFILVNTFTHCFSKNHFGIILPSAPRFPNQNYMCMSNFVMQLQFCIFLSLGFYIAHRKIKNLEQNGSKHFQNWKYHWFVTAAAQVLELYHYQILY